MTRPNDHVTSMMLEGVDVPVLVKQKQALVRVIRAAETNAVAKPSDVASLNGILNLLDHIHDNLAPPAGVDDAL